MIHNQSSVELGALRGGGERGGAQLSIEIYLEKNDQLGWIVEAFKIPTY